MYRLRKGVHIDFAHTVLNYPGACRSIHGHTWFFEVCLQTQVLDKYGFVLDFGVLKQKVLTPIHDFLDHSFITGESVAKEVHPAFTQLGKALKASPDANRFVSNFHNAKQYLRGGMKLIVFPFNPTAELLCKWFYQTTYSILFNDMVHISSVRIYESLHPTESMIEYSEE